jgi:hypothetical protein
MIYQTSRVRNEIERRAEKPQEEKSKEHINVAKKRARKDVKERKHGK